MAYLAGAGKPSYARAPPQPQGAPVTASPSARTPNPLVQRNYSRKATETLKNMLKDKAEDIFEAEAPEETLKDLPRPSEA